MIKFSNGTGIRNGILFINTPVGDFVSNDSKCTDIGYTLRGLLNRSYEDKQLVYIDSYRGFGFTSALVNFAKNMELPLIVHSSNFARELIKEYGYDGIYGKDTVKKFNGIRGRFIKSNMCLIDVGVKVSELPDHLTYIGFTDFYENDEKFLNKDKNVESENKLSPKDLLKNELKELGNKIQKVRRNDDIGTYKNLILAYKEVLHLLMQLDVNISELE